MPSEEDEHGYFSLKACEQMELLEKKSADLARKACLTIMAGLLAVSSARSTSSNTSCQPSWRLNRRRQSQLPETLSDVGVQLLVTLPAAATQLRMLTEILCCTPCENVIFQKNKKRTLMRRPFLHFRGSLERHVRLSKPSYTKFYRF